MIYGIYRTWLHCYCTLIIIHCVSRNRHLHALQQPGYCQMFLTHVQPLILHPCPSSSELLGTPVLTLLR